jgi:hypothetical protein
MKKPILSAFLHTKNGLLRLIEVGDKGFEPLTYCV